MFASPLLISRGEGRKKRVAEHPTQRFLERKNALYLSVNVFSTKVLFTGDTIFRGLAACSAKAVPSFLSYFKTLSIDPVLEIEPVTSHLAVKCYTD